MNLDMSAKIFSLASSVLKKSVLSVCLSWERLPSQVNSVCKGLSNSRDTLQVDEKPQLWCRWVVTNAHMPPSSSHQSCSLCPKTTATQREKIWIAFDKIRHLRTCFSPCLELFRALCCKLQCWPDFHIAHHPDSFGGDSKDSFPRANEKSIPFAQDDNDLIVSPSHSTTLIQ